MDVKQSEKEWKYDAFISYRHLEPDAFVAGTIHKLLESYKIPSKLAKDSGRKLKRTKISKVFRDAEELPLTSNLNDSIMEALTNSEYLIVICSPRLNESLWCRKEIETFVEMRGLDHVLTVLAEGEPSVSFPELLLYKETEVVQEDGTVKKVKEPLEPLAADARGNSNKERLKKLKIESLRLMAPMFGCSFDDLRQRERERKLRRAMGLAAIIAGVSIAFGVVSTSMALKISSQNSQISEQNEQISAQAEEIERQYQEVLISNANAVADYSGKLLEEGDRIEAIKRAYEVYPHEGVDIPRMNNVEYLLSDALNLYENGYSIKADRLLTCDSAVNKMYLSPDADRLVAIDTENTFYFWDNHTGQRLGTFGSEDTVAEERGVAFKNENECWFVADDVLYFYDIDAQKATEVREVADNCRLSYSEDMNRLLAVDYYGFYLIDAMDNSTIAERKFEDITGEKFTLSLGDSTISKYKYDYFAVAVSTLKNEGVKLCIYDTKDGNLIDVADIAEGSVGAVKIYGDEAFVSVNYQAYETDFWDMDASVTDIYDFKIGQDGLDLKWKKSITGGSNSDIAVSSGGEGKYVACQFFDKLYVLDHDTGETVSIDSFDGAILKLYSYLKSEQFSVISKNGNWYVVADNIDEPMNAMFFECRESYITSFETNGEVTAVSPLNGDTITIYRYAESPKAEMVTNYEPEETTEIENKDEILDELAQYGVSRSFVRNVFYSDDMSIMGIQYRNDKLELFGVDADGNIIPERHATIGDIDGDIDGMKIRPDKELVIMYGPSCGYIFNTEDIDLDNELPNSDEIIGKIHSFRGVDFENNCVYVALYDDYVKIPIYSSDEIAALTKKELANSGIE